MSTRKQKQKRRKLALSEFTRCHPRIKGKRATCLPDSVSSRMLKTWKVHSLEELWAATSCAPGADHCLLEKSGLEDKEKKDLRGYLRPRYPAAWRKKPDTWLDNVNIAQVMEQYQEAFPWFRFMGVFPIDFSIPDPYRTDGVVQCLHKDICSLQLKDEYTKRGIRGIGFIFNLDPHDKGGSHWVGLYIDLHAIVAPQISYFDSYGYKTPAMIARLMRAFTLQIPGCRLAYNARRYQRGGTECGMFSMYFLICMIHGIPFDQFCKDAVDDQMMLQLRPILFSS